MQKIRKYKNVVERFLSGEGGQRFFNIAYSLGEIGRASCRERV